jgi:hypothetical protein
MPAAQQLIELARQLKNQKQQTIIICLLPFRAKSWACMVPNILPIIQH